VPPPRGDALRLDGQFAASSAIGHKVEIASPALPVALRRRRARDETWLLRPGHSSGMPRMVIASRQDARYIRAKGGADSG